MSPRASSHLLNLSDLSVIKSCLLLGGAETALAEWYLECNSKTNNQRYTPKGYEVTDPKFFTLLLAKEL